MRFTGEWVLVSPHRAKRPGQGQNEAASNEISHSYDDTCFLCAEKTLINEFKIDSNNESLL